MRRIGLLIVVFIIFCLQASAIESSPLWSTYPASRWNITTDLASSFTAVPLSLPSSDYSAPEWALEIYERINYRVTVDLRNATLNEAADLMRDVLRCNLILSSETLVCDREFSLRVKAMRGELFLDWMCRLTDADWEIRDEAIFIFLKSERPRFEEDTMSIEEIILEELEKEGYTPPDFIPDPFPTENHID